MKFKVHWGKAKVIKRFRSPLQETDYEGNDLWSKAFPKPRPLTNDEIALWNYLKDNQMTYWDHMCQQANQQIYWQQHNPYGFGVLLGGLGSWL